MGCSSWVTGSLSQSTPGHHLRESQSRAWTGWEWVKYCTQKLFLQCNSTQSITRTTNHSHSSPVSIPTYCYGRLLSGQHFCLVVDRFSNWLQVYRGKGRSRNLIPLLAALFNIFRILESLASDEEPQYIADDFQDFLKKLGISSVGIPHANQKAE